MKAIYFLQWQRMKQSPLLILSMLGLTIVFVFIISGMGGEDRIKLYAYSDSSVTAEQQEVWMERLNASEVYSFELKEEAEARQAVTAGVVSLAVHLMEEDYRILAAADDQNQAIVDQFVRQIYLKELQIRTIEQQMNEGSTSGITSEFRMEVNRNLEHPTLTLTTTTQDNEGEGFIYDGQLQGLFGMTLFFVIFTITIGLSTVVEEKRSGTWDRLILSPVKKWEVYIGYLSFCFTIGYAQIILMFLLFQHVFGFDLGERWGTILIIAAFYTFAIVALGMLLMGIVTKPEQLQAVIPVVAVSFAMLGGAQWPLEAVTNEIMLTLSKFIPVTYGMEALKGAAIYNRSLLELAEPMVILLCFGILFMGIGINLMERRKS